jgi:DNA-binding CsgD family transcriptional regulator
MGSGPQRCGSNGAEVERVGEICVHLPLVACVGTLATFRELLGGCPVQSVSGGVRAVQAEIIVVDTDSESALAWADANPRTPVLEVREQVLTALVLGRWRLVPPISMLLREPIRFITGIVLAAKQLEARPHHARPRRTLTPRELEILYELAQGQRAKSVARKLNISENTVKQHLTNARHKLRAPDKTSAVLCAIRDGLIPFPNPPHD